MTEELGDEKTERVTEWKRDNDKDGGMERQEGLKMEWKARGTRR